jgi:hypothetical protein
VTDEKSGRKKIANDFGRYLDIQEMLAPLDLY